ncbi:MAG TPA: hypothetical protein VFV19_01405 [Candidatus Polarisedimenticolaceae bacterium]|nr:hypothetical protein [Candidatus Polarisedimenticolaceae bacterium]
MKREDLERRERAFHDALRDRHARIDPDGSFSRRVLERLPAEREWGLDWAAWRVLPASVALAGVLAVAALITHGRTVAVATNAAPSTSAASSESDPLEWLLEGGQVTR